MKRLETRARASTVLRRHAVTLLGLAMIVTGGVWAAVAWAQDYEITIDTPGPGEEPVNFDDLEGEEDVQNQKYNVDGRPYTVESGWSLQKVLSHVGIEADEWSRISINNESVVNGEEFVDKLKPVFDLDRKGVYFVVPKREGQKGVILKDGLSINLLWAIEIAWNEKKPKEGDTRTFTATVVNGGDQSDYAFKWDAGGETGSGREFEYTFDSAGEVVIGVKAILNETVAEGSVSTNVDESNEDDDDGDGSGGSGTGGSGGGGGYNYGGYGGGYGGSGPSYDSNFPNVGGGPSSPNSPAPPTDKDDVITLEDDSGTSVTGELLSATTPLPPSSAEEGATEDEPAPQEVAEEAREVSAPGALIAGGIIVGLLGLGAGRELENVRPSRFLRRPDLSGLRRLSPPWK